MTDFQFPPGRLRTLDDVTFGTPTNGQVMAYDSATGKVKFVDPGSIADGSVTNAKLATVATSTIKGRATAGTGAVEDLTAAQARTVLGLAAIATSGSASDLGTGTVPVARLGNATINLVGLNGLMGGAGALDGVATTNLPVGTTVYFRDSAGIGWGRLAELVDNSGTSYTPDGEWIIEPADDANKAWIIRLYGDSEGSVRVKTIYGNGVNLSNLNASNASSGTLPAARLADNISWDSWAMDLVPTTNVGYATYRHSTKPISGPAAKSGSATLQTGTLRFAPRRAPYGLAAYKTTGAFKFTYTADDNDSANVKITSCTLYGSNDLDTWVSVYNDSTARTPASANAITTVSINAASLSPATVYAYYAVEFGVSVRSSKCLHIANVEVNGQ